MTNDYETAHKEIERLFNKFSDAPGILGEIVKRWEEYPEGEKVLKSLIRQEIRQEKEHTMRRPESWPMSLRSNMLLLLMKTNNWFYETQSKQLRPRERKEAINRIIVNSMNIFMDFGSLGLPVNASKYFTQDELFERYQQLFQMFDLPDELTEPGCVDFRKDLKPYVETYWGDYPKSDVLLPALLMKLANPDLLAELAAPAIVSKTESENFPRVFMIRKLAGWFTQIYGKELHNTVANLCVLVFDDTSIDRDTVRSALCGFKVKAETTWFKQYPKTTIDLFLRGDKKLPIS